MLPPRLAAPRPLALAVLLVLGTHCASPPRAPETAVVVAPPPPPRPSCGAVEVADRDVPPRPERAVLVKDRMRERLAALNACGPLYRIHVDIRIDQVGVGGARIKLFVVVYARGGALVAEIPTTVSGNRFSPDDLAATNELLVAAAEHAAFAFSDHYH